MSGAMKHFRSKKLKCRLGNRQFNSKQKANFTSLTISLTLLTIFPRKPTRRILIFWNLVEDFLDPGCIDLRSFGNLNKIKPLKKGTTNNFNPTCLKIVRNFSLLLETPFNNQVPIGFRNRSFRPWTWNNLDLWGPSMLIYISTPSLFWKQIGKTFNVMNCWNFMK